jgi:hypothetical protein
MVFPPLVLILAFVLAGGPAAAPGPGTVRFSQGAYGCPMHPEVRADAPASCPRCGMAMTPMGPAGGPAYPVRLEAVPSAPRPGETVRLRFTVVDPATNEPVRRFQIVHDMPFHLFVVSDDLEHYDHVHPTLGADGSLELETRLPAPGAYSLFCDFLPEGGTPQVARLRLGTEGVSVPAQPPPAPLTADRSWSKTADGMRIDLELVPSPPAAGSIAMLRYHLTDEATGQPIRDLEPYLAAWGHTLVLNDDASEYVHSHPVKGLPPGEEAATARGGPDVAFSATILTPGKHRAWSQFRRGGKVTTVTFTFDVAVPQHLARWDGARWRALGDGGLGAALDGPVHALTFAGGALYAGGEFKTAGGAPAASVARWDGARWSALGEGLSGTVWALASRGNELYAGGEFPQGVARWDGKAWRPLGAGVDGSVHAMTFLGGRLVVGGRFHQAGGAPARSIAAWTGSRWIPLGGGVGLGDFDGFVWALASRGGELFAGGEFVTAGKTEAYNVARWDGRAWSALGGGLRGGVERVCALGFLEGDLVAGGEFTRAGDVAVLRLAAWNGAAWRAVGVDTSETVRALASGPDLYVAGGTFSWPGGGRATGVARRGGGGWSGLGEGLSSGAFLAPVLVVAPHAGDVYAGGGPFILR